MQGLDELVLLESDGVLGKYLCTKTNEIMEGVGTIAVPRGDKIEKYRGMVIWSSEQPITIQRRVRIGENAENAKHESST